MSKAYLVYNPAAGRSPGGAIIDGAARVLEQAGWNIDIKQANSALHITQLASQAASEKYDAFFVAGGDGSLNLAVAGLVGSNTALGVLPAGTANVWAQELGLTSLNILRTLSLADSAARLATANAYSVDVGVCNGRPFLLWAGVGLDAFIVHRIEPRTPMEKHFAVIQYTLSALWNAGFWAGMNLRAEVNGQQISGRYLLAVVSNIHLYAGGVAKISPGARLDDGLMDLWLFKGDNLGDTVQIAWDLWVGRHAESTKAECICCHSLRLESDQPLYVQVDGEPAPESNHVEIALRPQALKVLIPDQAPFALVDSSHCSDRVRP